MEFLLNSKCNFQKIENMTEYLKCVLSINICYLQLLFFFALLLNSVSNSSIDGKLIFKFSGIASVSLYSLIPIGLLKFLSKYSVSILVK